MKQNDWTEKLRDRLANHQEAVPDDLWDAIDARLRPAPKNAWPWYRWAAAAAVVLLLVGGTLVLWNSQDHDMPAMEAEAADLPGMDSIKEEMNPEVLTTESMAVADIPITTGSRTLVDEIKTTVQAPVNNDPFTASNESFTASNESSTANNESSTANNESFTASNESFTASNESFTAGDESFSASNEQQPVVSPDEGESPAVLPVPYSTDSLPSVPVGFPDRHRRLMASLYTENGLADHNHTNPVQMSSDLAQRFSSLASNNMDGATARMQSPIWLTDYKEQKNHHRPLAIGLKVSYPFSDRLTIMSGLVYTRQQSEFTNVMKGYQTVRQQTLHYVGLPLSLEYQLIGWGGLSVYASAGSQVDWNVKSRMNVKHIETDGEKDRCQWSLSGSVGLAYQLTSHFGLYAESGVRHYFDNHSRVNNFFKDHPTSLSLQVGFRINIGQDGE